MFKLKLFFQALPQNGITISNPIYYPQLCDELEDIPKICRSQITLGKILGNANFVADINNWFDMNRLTFTFQSK